MLHLPDSSSLRCFDFSVNTGGKIAHIGGAAFGYLFTLRYKNGRDFTMGFSRFIDQILYLFRPRKENAGYP